MIGLEALRVKLSSKQILQIFKHLDKEQKGFINYTDFCHLCDEKRMNIDPASLMY